MDSDISKVTRIKTKKETDEVSMTFPEFIEGNLLPTKEEIVLQEGAAYKITDLTWYYKTVNSQIWNQ